MNRPKNIVVHHTAVSRDKNNEQFDAVDRYHKSKGWGMIGYHYLIEPDGKIKQGREDNQAGAHTSQKLMNYRSIGICLTGHFDLEEPTIEQCRSLHSLIERLMRLYDIPEANIFPHRHFATYKSCWGSRLPNDILGYLETVLKDKPKWKRDLERWADQYIHDMDKLLQLDPHSVIALIKRAVDDK